MPMLFSLGSAIHIICEYVNILYCLFKWDVLKQGVAVVGPHVIGHHIVRFGPIHVGL